jgi:hypothetical protein
MFIILLLDLRKLHQRPSITDGGIIIGIHVVIIIRRIHNAVVVVVVAVVGHQCMFLVLWLCYCVLFFMSFFGLV